MCMFDIFARGLPMRHPSLEEEGMLTAAMTSIAEEASTRGVGAGMFHGYAFSATRIGRRSPPGLPTRIRVELKQEGVLLGSGILVISGKRHPH